MMSSYLSFSTISGFLGGLFLGTFYFVGLWWSVARIKQVKSKKLFLFISWLVRLAVLCAGLFFLARQDARMLISGVLGLFIARFFILRTVKKKIKNENPKIKENVVC